MKFKVGTRNEPTRETWLMQALRQIPAGSRILDPGAGQRRHKKLCRHLEYISQDFVPYDGRGDGSGPQAGSWDQSKIDMGKMSRKDTGSSELLNFGCHVQAVSN